MVTTPHNHRLMAPATRWRSRGSQAEDLPMDQGDGEERRGPEAGKAVGGQEAHNLDGWV